MENPGNKYLFQWVKKFLDETPSNKTNTLYFKMRCWIGTKILNLIDATIFIYDLNIHQYVWSNGNYKRLLGYTFNNLNKLYLQNWEQLYHPDDVEIVQQQINVLKDTENKAFSGFFRMKHKEGRWVWIFCRTVNLKRNPDGTPGLVLGIAIDISDQIHTRNQFVELFKEHKRTENTDQLKILTPREREVIIMLSKGYSCKEIAKYFNVSYHTIDTHRKNIARKLNINNKASLIQFAMENGLN
jgi:PAS domain S-box-containing protein